MCVNLSKNHRNRLRYFQEPAISKATYRMALASLGETITAAIASAKREDSFQLLQQIFLEVIRIHCENHGVSQAKKDLRLLGNAIRIATHLNSDIEHAISEIFLGVNAGALKLDVSGESSCFKEVCKYIRSKKRIPTIFDIGANKGEWTKQAIANLEYFSIHMFEPNRSLKTELNEVIQTALENNCNLSSVHINMLGIGDPGKTDLFVSSLSNEMASTVLAGGKPFYKSYERVEIEMINADTYCKLKNIDEIDFLKIDTEGSELKVLESFGNMLLNGKIRFVQFEYGMASFYGNSSLLGFFNLMENNYSIHRIFPEGITERLKYSEDIETFNWSNFLAIRTDSADLLNCLSDHDKVF